MKKIAILALSLALGFAGTVAVGHLLQKEQPSFEAHRAQWEEVYRTRGGLVAGADLVVVARHVLAEPGRVVGTVPFTYNGFEVERVVKGTFQGRDLILEQTGGRLGEKVVSIDDGGPFVSGQSYLLFLKAQPGSTGVYYQINHQARYAIENGRLAGVDPTDAVVAGLHGRPATDVLESLGRHARRVQ